MLINSVQCQFAELHSTLTQNHDLLDNWKRLAFIVQLHYRRPLHLAHSVIRCWRLVRDKCNVSAHAVSRSPSQQITSRTVPETNVPCRLSGNNRIHKVQYQRKWRWAYPGTWLLALLVPAWAGGRWVCCWGLCLHVQSRQLMSFKQCLR